MVLNKKGVSGVITAVLLILLVIAAIGVLWVVVQTFVQNQTDFGDTTGCLNTQMKVNSATTSSVSVQRVSGDATISEVLVYVDDAIVSTNDGEGDMAVGEVKSITLSPVLITGDYKISVAPKVGEQTCSRSADFDLTVP